MLRQGGFIMVNYNDIQSSITGDLAFSREMPIVFDEDCPETTPERAVKFKRVNPPRRTDARRA